MYLDIVILVVLVLAILDGLKNGLFVEFLSVFGLIINFVAAKYFTPILMEFLKFKVNETNYFIIYPLYSMFLMMPMDTIINAYHNIYPFVTDLWTALLVCNLPFTFLKCMVSVVITFICYKYLSPIIKGEKKQTAKK